MNKHFVRLTSCTLAIAAVLFAAKVVSDYDHSADFSRYKTYSWIEVKSDPLWTDRIRHAVDSQLINKGWSMVPADGDASVAAVGSAHTEPRIETFYSGLGGGWRWRGFSDGIATTTVEQTPIGTLVVDLFDTPTKKLIWRGVARDTLSDKPEKNEKKLENAVGDMFKHFPPPPRG